MEFKSIINLHKPHAFAEGGFKKDVQVYELLINKKTGKEELVPTEKEPFYKKIQEQTEGQLLETIINRYQLNIDDKHITQLKEEVIDMTVYPEDLLSAYALGHQLEKQFNEGPADIKNYFKDFAGYVRSFQAGTLKEDLEKIALINKGKKVVPQQPTGQTSAQVQQPTGQTSVQVQQPTGQTSAQVQQPTGQTSAQVQTQTVSEGGHF